MKSLEIPVRTLGDAPEGQSVLVVADTTELAAVITTFLSDGTLVTLRDGSKYVFNSNATTGGIIPTTGNGRWWLTTSDGEAVNVKTFGAVGDGIIDDTDAIQNAIDSVTNGCVYFPAGTYIISQRLELDISKCGIVSNGAIIDGTGSDVGTLRVFGSAVYAERDKKNWGHSINGLILLSGGALTCVEVGRTGATYENSNEICFRDCSIHGGQVGIKFADNAWRAKFERCGIVFQTGYYIDYDNPANAGEVMAFEHCWICDGVATIRINNGQFVFDGCSTPGGGTGGFVISNAAIVRFFNCNLETQALVADQRLITASQSAVVIFDGCNMTFGGQMNRAPFLINDAASFTIINCPPPLYGDVIRSEANDSIRCLIAGNSPYIKTRDNYIASTGLQNQPTKMAVMADCTNIIANGSAETGNTNGWTVQTYGGTLTGTMVSSAVNPKVGANCFRITAPADGGVECRQAVNCGGMAGRTAVFGFWVKRISGHVGDIDFPAIRCRDTAGNILVQISVVAVTDAVADWTWYANYLPIPAGAATIEAVIGAQQTVEGVVVDYDGLTLNII